MREGVVCEKCSSVVGCHTGSAGLCLLLPLNSLDLLVVRTLKCSIVHLRSPVVENVSECMTCVH